MLPVAYGDDIVVTLEQAAHIVAHVGVVIGEQDARPHGRLLRGRNARDGGRGHARRTVGQGAQRFLDERLRTGSGSGEQLRGADSFGR